MKILPRTEFGNPILREKAREVSLGYLKTDEFKELVEDMIHTMREAPGVGLAAPQVGVSLAIAVMEMRVTPTRPNLEQKGPIVIVNPKITRYSQGTVSDYEGCLSFNGVRGSVPRSESITVEYLNEHGEKVVEEATGFWARIFQHEIDHLNGVVYIDRVEDTKTVMTLKEYKKRILKQNVEKE